MGVELYTEGKRMFLYFILKRGREGAVFSMKSFVMNDEVAYKRLTKSTMDVELRKIGKYYIKMHVNERTKFGRYNWAQGREGWVSR
jgi:hypothetical protein